jgi:dethiobiotin synthetase
VTDRLSADFLVTGTDTGIGKTIIAAALIKALRAYGVRALGFKPIETGPPNQGEGRPSDSELLARASGETTPLATPLLQLAEPLAPAVAAERAGTTIHPEEIEKRIDLLRRAGYTPVVEGAGGVMVPLAWQEIGSGVHRPHPFYTVLDLAEQCGLEAVIVGRAGLGTLNHVTMTVAMLRSRHIPVKAVVLNGRRPEPLALSPDLSALSLEPSPDLSESTNPGTLARMLPGVLIIEVPRHDRHDRPDRPERHDHPDAQAIIDATVPYLTTLLP